MSKRVLSFIGVLGLTVFVGCSRTQLLTVDFQKNQVFRYKFVSSRDTVVDWEPAKIGTAKRVEKHPETMEMVVAYTPVEVQPYGLTTIEAKCESVQARRGQSRVVSKDAVESFAGKTFTLKVSPSGKIQDYSELEKLVLEAGQKAFRKDGVKEPDMIGDFIATQWFLWDSISSIERPEGGVSVGQSWTSELSVPTPMLLRCAREVTYTLEAVRETNEGKIAVIKSRYSLGGEVPAGWPTPYKTPFQMSGTFGFLGKYRVHSLQGQGEELFNIDKGRIEQYNQQYQIQLEASLLIPIGVNPMINITQTLTMQLLQD